MFIAVICKIEIHDIQIKPDLKNDSIIKINIFVLISKEGEIWENTDMADVFYIRYEVVCVL